MRRRNGLHKHMMHGHIYKDVRRYHRFAKGAPILFLLANVLLFYFVIKAANSSNVLAVIIVVITLIFLKDFGTFIFGRRLAKKILEPIHELKELVDEITQGNYGKTITKYPHNDIGNLIKDFNEMSLKLKENEDIKEQYENNRKLFIANISHDLKTPITSILGHAQGLKEGVADKEDKREKYIDIIHNNAVYSNKLIEDLFLISQLDINQYDYHFESTSAKYYFEDLFLELQCELEEEHIEFKYNIDLEDSTVVQMDNKAIRQVLLNIITNSKKYADVDDLIINASVTYVDKILEVSVKDNGRGINQEEVSKIFDRFYRIDKARRNSTGGSGLGLSICKEIIMAHGGMIKAESKIDEYTEIVFTINRDGDNYE